MTDTITREQALKLADEAVAALKGWRHESECPPDEVHAICNAAIKYYIDQQAALASPQPEPQHPPRVTPEMFASLQRNIDTLAAAHNKRIAIEAKYRLLDEALKAALAAPQPKGLFVDMLEAHGLQEPQPVKQATTVLPNIPDLLVEWERRSKDALPADAMLINKHIRELRETIGATQ